MGGRGGQDHGCEVGGGQQAGDQRRRPARRQPDHRRNPLAGRPRRRAPAAGRRPAAPASDSRPVRCARARTRPAPPPRARATASLAGAADCAPHSAAARTARTAARPGSAPTSRPPPTCTRFPSSAGSPPKTTDVLLPTKPSSERPSRTYATRPPASQTSGTSQARQVTVRSRLPRQNARRPVLAATTSQSGSSSTRVDWRTPPASPRVNAASSTMPLAAAGQRPPAEPGDHQQQQRLDGVGQGDRAVVPGHRREREQGGRQQRRSAADNLAAEQVKQRHGQAPGDQARQRRTRCSHRRSARSAAAPSRCRGCTPAGAAGGARCRTSGSPARTVPRPS